MRFRLPANFFSLSGKVPGLALDSFYALGLRGGGLVLSYLFSVVVMRQFGARGYGAFTITLDMTIYFLLLGKAGMDLLLLKKVGVYQARGQLGKIQPFYRLLLRRLLPLNIALSIIYFFLAKPLAVYWVGDSAMTTPLLIATVYIIPSVAYIFHSEGLRALSRPYHYIFIHFSGLYFFNILFFYGFKFFGYTQTWMPILVHAISCVLLAGLSVWWWNRQRPSAEQEDRLEEAEKQGIFQQAFPFFTANTTQLFINVTGGLAVAYFMSTEATGLYNMSFRLANLISMPMLATASLAAGRIALYYEKGEYQDLQSFIRKLHYLNSLLGLGLIALFYFGGEWFLALLFDVDFSEALPALLWLAAGFLINTLAGSTDLMLQLTGHERLFQTTMLIGGIINIGLTVVLVPLLGIKGAGIAFTTAMLVINALAIYFIRKKTGIRMLLFQL